MVHFFKGALNFVGVMYFTYVGDPLSHTMKKYGSGPGPEKLVAQTPGMCGF